MKLLPIKKETMIIDINEVEKCLHFFQKINESSISEIEWVCNGELLKPTKEQLDDFMFTGLSNKDFPSVMGWLPDDLGIRISVITMTKCKD